MKSRQVVAVAAVAILGLAVTAVAFLHPKRQTSMAVVVPAQALSKKELWHCGMHPQVIQDHPGDCPICHMALTPLAGANSAEPDQPRKILYWWDPMLGPKSIADGPGKSAMGMDRVPVYAADVRAGPTVTIDPIVVQNMGVRTSIVRRGPVDVTVRAVGMLKVPQPGLHEVSPRVGGWIEKLYADTDGMHVHKGEVLFDLYSPELQVASEELISAVRSRKTVGPNAAEEVKKDADGLVLSARQKLGQLDISEDDINAIARVERPPRTIPFRSPADGDVIELSVVAGSAVQAGMKLLRIEDHTKLWLDAEVYEDQIPLVSTGQPLEATLDAMPSMAFRGTVSFVYPHVDHMTRTETVRALLNNPDAKLKPGMYGTVSIITRPEADAILAPREAVIDTGARKIAFVAEAKGHFSPRSVKTGLSADDGSVQILQGLAPGEFVVTSGQFLMDVESRTTEAIDKLRNAPPATRPSDVMTDASTPAPGKTSP